MTESLILSPPTFQTSMAAEELKVLLPCRVPQLKGIPITLYGHSWTVPSGWHTTGSHWTTRLPTVGDTGVLTNQGVGGTTMEFADQIIDGNPADGSFGLWDWGYPTTKSLCLVMDVLNSVYKGRAAKTAFGLSDAQILNSFKEAVRFVAAVVVSTRISPVAGSVVQSGTGWAAIAGQQMFCDGVLHYSFDNGAKITWTPAASAAAAWMVSSVYNTDYGTDTSAVFKITKNGVLLNQVARQTRTKVPQPNTASEPFDYMKAAIPLGAVVAGQPVVIEKISGYSICNDGFLALGANSHACFVKDQRAINSATYPDYDTATIDLFNAALEEVKAEFDAIATDLVSLIDLNLYDDFDHATMLWSGDTVHPNDRGQAWLLAKMTNELKKCIPWTTRLHVL